MIAGGQESMSNAPYLVQGARDGLRFGHASMQDSMIQDGLWDAFNDYHMGITAENLADAFDISRPQQDAFAALSQRKAAAAIAAGRFQAEIVPLSVPQGKKAPRRVDADEQPRPETSEQQLAQLRPAFRTEDGSVTAGNASSLNDGAAAVLLMSVDKARQLGLPVLARIVSSAVAGVDPSVMGIGPVSACRKALQRAGWALERWISSKPTRPLPYRRWQSVNCWSGTTRKSTSTAALSRSAIQLAPQDVALWLVCCTRCSAAMSAKAWRRFASAAVRVSR